MYLGNFGRKPHHYYTANKNKVQNATIVTTGRTFTSRAQQQDKKRIALSKSSNAEKVAACQNMIRVPQNLRHMVSEHNAMATNFFEVERLQHMLNKAKILMATHLPQLDSIEVRRVKGNKSQHLIEFTFNNAMAQSMPPQKYSKLLQTLIPQHQL